MYAICFDTKRNLLDIQWGDLFSSEDVEAYARAVRAGFVQHGFSSGYLLRMDMSRSAVQPQDAVSAFRTQFRDFPRARRIAIVTPSAITRMQVLREMKQPYLQVFPVAEEALDWLLDEECEAVTA